MFLALSALALTAMMDLDGSQQRLLKDAEYYMKEVDKAVTTLAAEAEKLSDLRVFASLTQNALQSNLHQVNHAGQKLNNVISRLQQLPAENTAVAEMTQRMQSAASQLLALENSFKTAQVQLTQLQDPANWPDLIPDTEKLEGFSGMLTVPTLLESDPARATEICRELPAMRKFFAKIQSKYDAYINQETNEARELNRVASGFEYRIKGFEEAAQRWTQNAPNQIQRYMDQTAQMSQNAIQSKNPKLLTVGCVNQMNLANLYISQLEVLTDNDATAQSLRGQYNHRQQELAKVESSLKEEIIGSNTPPKDLYFGGDKQSILDDIKQRWMDKYGKDEVLGLRIPMNAWERRTGWKFALDEFQKHDYSEMQVAIVVKRNSEQATVYYAYLKKDHLSGDRIKVTLDDKSGEDATYRQLLLENWDG